MADVPKILVLSTAGAIPVKNEKGQLTMEKVKVSRYVTGKRPKYAPYSSDEEEDGGVFIPTSLNRSPEHDEDTNEEENIDDRRVKRLMEMKRRRDSEDSESNDEDMRVARHRRQVEVEDYREEEDIKKIEGIEMSDEEENLSDEEIRKRRDLVRRKALNHKMEEELMDIAEESSNEEVEQEESEYEEYTDSEEDEENPRLKPVFVRKEDRLTIQEKERQVQKEKDREYESRRLAQERRQQTLRMVEAEIKRDMETKTKQNDDDGLETGDENEEEAYEAWKVRELKRLKRDREERELHEREKQENDRVHGMTEEERRQEHKLNPKTITNKAAKGKYKFLQKYYHRGVFYLDKEESILKRDYTIPTLDDQFNKTVLPKVMQVKNFGRSGRTKYTHLVDQDTTQFDSPWMADTAMNLKFHTNKGGGMKQSIDGTKSKR